ncbi:hypothetical protein [Nonomuraea sp. SBT364]|uniref:hypothetical protein n=1 Tax=Nonomuraea sp. SBT364 TaxID=1580530 RepID=UPI00066E9CA8|nr:hypothetical protein [Nonomuraea sp. SBT364]
MTTLYGGSDSLINHGRCARCEQPIDRHKVPYIRPDGSAALLDSFKDAVYRLARSVLQKSGPALPPATMMGAAVASFKSQKMLYVTISGDSAGKILPNIDRKGLPKETIFVQDTTVLVNGKLLGIKGQPFTPAVLSWRDSADIRQERYFTPGQCAAQKLLSQIFTTTKQRGAAPECISLAETFFRDYPSDSGKRIWDTADFAESCDTCKQVLPQMLCDLAD